MALTGQAKTEYQREYMRRRRSNAISDIRSESVRPEQTSAVRPKKLAVRSLGVSDNAWAYIQSKAEASG